MGKDKQKHQKQSPVQLHIRETNIYEQGKGNTKVKEVTDTIESTKRVKKAPVDVQMNGENETNIETAGDVKVSLEGTTEGSPAIEIHGDQFLGDLEVSKPIVVGISPDVQKVERIHQTIDSNEAFREFQEALKSPGMGVRFQTVSSSEDKIITTFVERHEEDGAFEQTTTIQEIKKTVGTLPKAKGKFDVRAPGLAIKTPSHEETGHAELDLPELPQGHIEVTPLDIDLNTSEKKQKVGKFGIFGKRKRKTKEDKESDKSSETDKLSDTHDPKHPKWEIPRFNLKKGKGNTSGKVETDANISGQIEGDVEFGGKPYPPDGDVSATDSEQDQVTIHVDVPKLPEEDMDVNINLPKVDISTTSPQFNIHGKQEEQEEFDIEVKKEDTGTISRIIHQKFLIGKETGEIKDPNAQINLSVDNISSTSSSKSEDRTVEIIAGAPDINIDITGKKPKFKNKKHRPKQLETENVDIDIKEEGKFGIHLPKFKFGKDKKDKKAYVESPKVNMDIDPGSVEVRPLHIPETTEIKGPNIDVNIDGPKLPDVEEEKPDVEMDIDGDASPSGKHKFKFGLPNIKFGGRQGEKENVDVDIKEEGTGGSAGFDIHLPKIKFGKGRKGDVNIDGDAPDATLSGDIDVKGPSVPDADVDMSVDVKGPDVDVDLPEFPEMEIEGTQGDMDIDGNKSGDGKHKFKFGLPNFKFGGKQGEQENVDVDVKEEGTGGSGGFDIHLPSFKFGKGKKGEYDVNAGGDLPDADVSGDIDIKAPSLPEVDADVSADIKGPDVDVNVPDLPSVEIEGKSGDVDISGDASLDRKNKIKFGLPSFKFGGKQGEEENVDVDIKEEGTGGSGGFGIHLPKFKFGKGKKGDVDVQGDLPDMNVSGDVDIGGIDVDVDKPDVPSGDIDATVRGDMVIEEPEGDGKLPSVDVTPKGKHKFKFGLPKFKFGKGKKPDMDGSLDHSISSDVPDANISGDIDIKKPDLPDVDANMSADLKGPDVDVNVQGPELPDVEIEGKPKDIDISGDASLDRKHKIKFGLPSFKFGGKQGEQENVDVDVKEEGTHGSGGFGFHLPKFKFGKGKKGDVKVEGDIPEADVAGDINIITPKAPEIDVNTNISSDIDAPDVDVNIDGPKLPDVEVEKPDVEMDIDGDASPSGKHKFKFGLPNIKFGGRQGEKENVDVDIKEEGTGGSAGFDIHLPKIKFGKGRKGDVNIDGDAPDATLSGDIDVKGPSVPDADVDMSVDVKGPDVDVDLPEVPELEIEGTPGDMDIDGNKSGDEKHKFKFGLPNFKFGGKQGEQENVDVDVKEEGTGGSGGFDIHLPSFKFGKGKKGEYDLNAGGDLPDADVSGDIDIKAPSLPEVDADVSADIKGPDVDVNVPDLPSVEIEGKSGDVDISGDASLDRKNKIKFGLPSFKFGGKQGEEENVDVDIKEEGTGGSGGFGIHLPKFKFGKGKKGDVDVQGDLPDMNVSGDVDIGGIDVDVDKPDVPSGDIDATVRGDMVIEEPEGDGKLPSVDVTPKGKHKFKFGLPKIKFGKGKKPDMDGSLDHSISSDVPDANISGDIDIKKPDLPDVDANMSADLRGPDVDVNVQGPELPDVEIEGKPKDIDISGDASLDRKHKIKFGLPSFKFGGKQGEQENVDVDVKEEGTHGSGGFGFHLPKFKFGRGKRGEYDVNIEGNLPDANVSGDTDIKPPSLPEVDANVSADIKRPDVDVAADVPFVSNGNVDSYGSADIQTPPLPEVEGGVSVDIERPDMNINVDVPDVPNVEFEGISEDADISGDVSINRKDKKMFVPSFKLGGKQGEKENVDIDIKEEGLGRFGIHLPKIKFSRGKRGEYNLPAHDTSGEINVTNGDVDIPPMISEDLNSPDVNIDVSPAQNVKYTGDDKKDIKFPKFKFGKVKKGSYDVNVEGSLPEANISGDDIEVEGVVQEPSPQLSDNAKDSDDSKRISFNFPKFKFGRRKHKDSMGSSTSSDSHDITLDTKSPQIYASTGDTDIKLPNIPDVEKDKLDITVAPSLNVDTSINTELGTNIPQTDMPGVMIEIPNPDIDVPQISTSVDTDNKRNETKLDTSADVNLGDANNIPECDILVNIPESHIDSDSVDKKKKRFTLPKFSPKWKHRSKSPDVADDSFAQLGQGDSKQGTIHLTTGDNVVHVEDTAPLKNIDLEFDPKVQGNVNNEVDINGDDVPIAREEVNPLQTYEFPFENLVLQGKGSDCIAHVGVVKQLHEAGIYSQIKKFSGSGFGGLVAALLASGAGLKTMEIWLKNDIPKLTTARAKCLPINVVRKYGHTPEERIQNWLGQKLKCLLGDPNTTIGQLNNSKGKELTLIVTNASQMKTEKLTPKTTPNLPIKVGVRMCLAYQGMFKPVPYKIHDNEDIYISGCLLDPYPIETYDTSPQDDGLVTPCENTLGVLLQSSSESRDLTNQQQSISSHDERAVDISSSPPSPTEDVDATVDPKDLAQPMLRFLQTLQKYKVDKNCNGVSKNDLENMLLQRTSLPHDDLKLLFGEKRNVDDIFNVVGAKHKNEITYKELLNYFERKLNHHTKIKSGTLGRSKQQNKLETVYISVQEALVAAGIPLHITKQDLDRTIRIDTGDVSDLEMRIEENDKLYLIEEGQRATESYLRQYIEDKGLEPTSVEAGATNDPDLQFLLTREDISEMIDEELSEIINERDYNENCTYVGEYT